MCENRCFGYPEASQNLSLAFVFIKSPAAFILFTSWLGDVAENITSRRMQIFMLTSVVRIFLAPRNIILLLDR